MNQMPPKTLSLVECKKCGSQWYKGNRIELKPGDLVSILPSSISKCTNCNEIDEHDRRIPDNHSPRYNKTIPPYRVGNNRKRR